MTLDTSRPFTRPAALTAGITDHQLDGIQFRRIFHGVYVRAGIKSRLGCAGVESVMETRLRMLMVLARLPEPQVNMKLRADDGSWGFRIDLCYVAILLAIEYEGRQHAENAKQWNDDIRRRTKLEAMGWRIILVTAEGVFQHPEETLRDIKDALRARGIPTTMRRPSVECYREFVGDLVAA